MSRFLQKTVVGLVVVLCLMTPLASAAQRPQEVRTAAVKFSLPAPSEMFAKARRFLVRIWMKEGCGFDPHGACAPAPSTGSSVDAGCGIDPHGSCATSAQPVGPSSDAGCMIDPHGVCIGS